MKQKIPLCLVKILIPVSGYLPLHKVSVCWKFCILINHLLIGLGFSLAIMLVLGLWQFQTTNKQTFRCIEKCAFYSAKHLQKWFSWYWEYFSVKLQVLMQELARQVVSEKILPAPAFSQSSFGMCKNSDKTKHQKSLKFVVVHSIKKWTTPLTLSAILRVYSF